MQTKLSSSKAIWHNKYGGKGRAMPTEDNKAIVRLTAWVIASIIVVVLLLFVWGAYRFGWEWAGFVTFTTDKIDKKEVHLGKTLWDWLDLLIVPLVLIVGGYFLNQAQRQREQDIADENRKTDREIAKNREEEQALREYFEAMTELLLDKDLRTSEVGAEVRSVARARTLEVMRSFDNALSESKDRKGSVVRFLYEAGLIKIEDKEKDPIIRLDKAHLQGANLEGANLERAYLQGARLREANLEGAWLEGANLWETKLEGANLQGAHLKEASLGRAHLQGANLREASLGAANLQGANLEGANLEGAYLSGARYNTQPVEEPPYKYEPTIWPKGFDPVAAGAIQVQFP